VRALYRDDMEGTPVGGGGGCGAEGGAVVRCPSGNDVPAPVARKGLSRNGTGLEQGGGGEDAGDEGACEVGSEARDPEELGRRCPAGQTG